MFRHKRRVGVTPNECQIITKPRMEYHELGTDCVNVKLYALTGYLMKGWRGNLKPKYTHVRYTIRHPGGVVNTVFVFLSLYKA